MADCEARYQGGEFSILKPDSPFLTNRDSIQTFLPEITIHTEVRYSQCFVWIA